MAQTALFSAIQGTGAGTAAARVPSGDGRARTGMLR